MIEQFWLFHCGYFRLPENMINAGAGFGFCRIPFLSAVLVHPDHGPIVIDAPFGHEGPNNVGAMLGVTVRLLGQQFKREWGIIARIREVGFRAAEVNHVLMTHLHYDHTGGMKELAHATFHVNEAEWAYANDGGGLATGYVRNDYKALTQIETFDETGKDIFGDGSVVARATPGHSIGHTGFRIRMTDGQVIDFLGDAAFSVAQIEDGVDFGRFPRSVAYKRELAEETLGRLRDEADENPEFVRLVSHDVPWGEKCRRSPVPLHS